METCFNYCNSEKAFFSSDERKWINKIHKLKDEHPDEVEIISEPEVNNGCIYAKVPIRWMRIQPPFRKELSEEERQVLRERMKAIRSSSEPK